MGVTRPGSVTIPQPGACGRMLDFRLRFWQCGVMSRKKIPKFPPMPELLQQMELFGGHGVLLENLWRYYEIKKDWWYRYLEKNPAVLDAFWNGRIRTGMAIAGKLIEKAMGGNVTAMIFYLKTQCGWVEHKTIGFSNEPPSRVIPKNLGTDPIKAAQVYAEVMK